MTIPESYRGREQAYVKHRLLQTYLERLFLIIGPYQRSIRYVDCFSGPWQEADENLGDTSISISLEIMRKCQGHLKGMGKNVAFQALFIEKDKKAFDKLGAYLKSASGDIVTDARNGEFHNLREDILDWCGPDDFTFFFIDPQGWKNVIEIPTLTPLLQRPNSEFLINFMYDFLLRTHTQESFREDMQAIFGEVPSTIGMTPEEKEEYLVRLYRKGLKEVSVVKGGKPRAVSVPVLYPTKDRPLYHLVYLTRHSKGITVFGELSEALDLVQCRVRADAKQDNRESKSGQLEMIPASTLVTKEKHADPERVKAYWLDRLSATPRRFGTDELADMMEETGWFESDFQAAFGELEQAEKVANIDAKGRRRKRFVHFTENDNKGERLKLEQL